MSNTNGGDVMLLPDGIKNLPFSVVTIDTETTGVDVTTARIVELGAVRVEAHGGGVQAIQTRINPGCFIPPEASRIHGITMADVRNAPTFADVRQELCDLIWPDSNHVDAIVGFNIEHFDLPIIAAEVARTGFAWPAIPDAYVPVIDVLALCKQGLRFRTDHSLGNMCRLFDVGHGPLHAASADALRTLAVLCAALEKFKIQVRTADELVALIERGRHNLDRHGRFIWWDDVVVVGFGKHFGRPLTEMVAKERSYLTWILESDFDLKTKAIIADAFRGILPAFPDAAIELPEGEPS